MNSDEYNIYKRNNECNDDIFLQEMMAMRNARCINQYVWTSTTNYLQMQHKMNNHYEIHDWIQINSLEKGSYSIHNIEHGM